MDREDAVCGSSVLSMRLSIHVNVGESITEKCEVQEVKGTIVSGWQHNLVTALILYSAMYVANGTVHDERKQSL